MHSYKMLLVPNNISLPGSLTPLSLVAAASKNVTDLEVPTDLTKKSAIILCCLSSLVIAAGCLLVFGEFHCSRCSHKQVYTIFSCVTGFHSFGALLQQEAILK